MEVGVPCHAGGVCFFPMAETKTGLNLQLNPCPAFDLVSRTGEEGRGRDRREGVCVKWGHVVVLKSLQESGRGL